MGRCKIVITLKMATVGTCTFTLEFLMHGFNFLQCSRKNKDFDPI